MSRWESEYDGDGGYDDGGSGIGGIGDASASDVALFLLNPIAYGASQLLGDTPGTPPPAPSSGTNGSGDTNVIGPSVLDSKSTDAGLHVGPAPSALDADTAKVQWAARALKQLGYPAPDTTVRLDPALMVAVRAFQAAHGLSVDGKLGPNTYAAISQALSGGGAVVPAGPGTPAAAISEDMTPYLIGGGVLLVVVALAGVLLLSGGKKKHKHKKHHATHATHHHAQAA